LPILPNGNTLISDSNNNRIIEVDPTDNIVWQYATNLQRGSNPAPLPTRAVRLRSGHTLISDQFNNRVIEVTRAGEIVFQQGALNVAGARGAAGSCPSRVPSTGGPRVQIR